MLLKILGGDLKRQTLFDYLFFTHNNIQHV